MLGWLIPRFSEPAADFEPPKTTYFHDMYCECGHRRCYGYTPERWRKLINGGVQ